MGVRVLKEELVNRWKKYKRVSQWGRKTMKEGEASRVSAVQRGTSDKAK